MSDKWETVTKSRKSKASALSSAIPDINGGGKQPAKNSIRMEDILSRQQIQSLYSGGDAAKKASPPTAKNKPNQANNNKSSIPAALIPATKQKTGPQQPRPKNLEAGLAALNIGELETLVDSYRNNFSDSHVVWLKAVIAYLNTNLNLDTNPTFTGHSPRYPANIVPNRLKTLIYQVLRDAGVANIHYFFDQTLTALTDDLSKNLPITGYKIMLQLIAIEWPSVCIKSLAKNAMLRNSYQNRAPIGLTLLWALGQGGYRDAAVGLRVWQNIMVPVLEMKSYTRFVVEYVHRVLHHSKASEEVALSADEFSLYFDELTLQRVSLPKDLQTLFDESAATLITKFVRAHAKVQPIFVALLKRLNSPVGETIMSGLTACLLKEAECLKAWRILFRKHASESNKLLHELNKPLYASFVGSKQFSDFLGEVRTILSAIPEGKVTDDIRESNRLVRSSQDKSAQLKSKSGCSIGCCTWIMAGLFLLVAGLATFVIIDTRTHGDVFANSATAKFLERTGTLQHVQFAWVKGMGPVARGYKLAEQHVPVYATHAYTVLHPYGIFLRDLSCVSWSYVKRQAAATCDFVHQKTPIVADFVEQYVPGLPQKVSDASVQLWTQVKSTSVLVYNSSFEFFKTKVFVGQLSPESLSQALNNTSIAVNSFNKWFRVRLEDLAKSE